MLSSGEIFKSRYVPDKQIISNLRFELQAVRRTSFSMLCGAMLLRCQWQKDWRRFLELYENYTLVKEQLQKQEKILNSLEISDNVFLNISD